MKIPSINAERIRRNALLTREMRREAWAMPALVLGAGVLFCSFGVLVDAVRRGHVGPWGVYVLYAVLAAFGALLGWSSLRGSKWTGGEGYEPAPPERVAIVSPACPDLPGFRAAADPFSARTIPGEGRPVRPRAMDVSVTMGLEEMQRFRVVARPERQRKA